MKRLGLAVSVLLLLVMAAGPLNSLGESIQIAKLPDIIAKNHWNTNNTTRVIADSWQSVQSQVQAIAQPSPVEMVIFTSAESWTDTLTSSSLLAYPNKAILIMLQGNDINEISSRLSESKPAGSNNLAGTQVLLVGRAATQEATVKSLGYKVMSVAGGSAEVAAKIKSLRERFEPSKGLYILIDQNSPAFAMPAANWAAHNGTPILIASQNSLPEATRGVLAGGNVNGIYTFIPPGNDLNQLKSALQSFGKVTDLAQKDPVSTSVNFANFYDDKTMLGWNANQTTNSGHKMFLVVNKDDWQYALAAMQLFSNKIFGPLIYTEQNFVPALVEKLYFNVKPDWWQTPAEGPYNHSWILGNADHISYAAQGRLNFLQEISSYQTMGDEGLSGIETLALVWYLSALACALWIWCHLSTRLFQLSPFMKIAWVLLALVLGPVGLWAYYTCYRGYAHQVARGEFPRPRWVQVLAATCSTAGFGLPIMISIAFILTYAGLPLLFMRNSWYFLGGPMVQSVIWSYLGTLLINAFLFVPLMLAFKENSSYWGTVKSNWLTVFISMTSISMGMMSVMMLLMMVYLDMMPEQSNLNWWFSMYVSSLVGILSGYIGNWILVVRGEKKGTM